MDLSRKLPIAANSIKSSAKQAGISSEALGKSLPATVVSVSGSLVTVNFEVSGDFTLPQIQVPVLGSEYIRLPIQSGCKGMVISSDYYLGNMSGLGTGKATFVRNGNLTNLVFVPIGNKSWSSVDGDVLTLYGVSGVLLKNSESGDASVSITSDDVTLATSGASVALSGSDVTITGTLSINGLAYVSHTHTNGNEGSPTGGVIT